MGGMQTVVIIPAFNEGATIASVICRVRGISPDVLVVDDGSSDATAERARVAGALVVRHCVNRGLGAAIGTGIAATLQPRVLSRGIHDEGSRSHEYADVMVTLDGDGQHDPTDIPALIAPIAAGEADIVIGVRRDRSAVPFRRRLAHAVANGMTRALFGVTCSDTQSGFRAFSRRAAEQIEVRTNRMEVSSEILAEAARLGLRVAEVPIRTIYTDYSLAKGQSFVVGLKTAWALVLRRWF